MYVSSSYLAQILSITDRRVRQLVEERVLTRDKKSGKYSLTDCVQKYIDYKVHTELGRDANYEKERALHEKAKREKAELQLAVMKGKLHDAEEIEMVMTDMIVNAKTKLRGIPIKIAPSLLAQDEINVVENIVAGAIDECLLELADYTPELFESPDLVLLDSKDDETYAEEDYE